MSLEVCIRSSPFPDSVLAPFADRSYNGRRIPKERPTCIVAEPHAGFFSSKDFSRSSPDKKLYQRSIAVRQALILFGNIVDLI